MRPVIEVPPTTNAADRKKLEDGGYLVIVNVQAKAASLVVSPKELGA